MLRVAFKKIKEEMNDHLDAINQNTTEINSNSSYILELENMINKLSERIDELELRLSGKKHFDHVLLNPKEYEIFLLLYSRNGDLINYREISRTLGLTEEIVHKQIMNIINKGVPIIKKYFDNNTYLVLDPDFRNIQAKENIVKSKI